MAPVESDWWTGRSSRSTVTLDAAAIGGFGLGWVSARGGAAIIRHRDQRPVNGQDHTTRGQQAVHPRPRRGPASGRTQFLAWTAWVVIALLGLEYLSGAGYLMAVVASGGAAAPCDGRCPASPVGRRPTVPGVHGRHLSAGGRLAGGGLPRVRHRPHRRAFRVLRARPGYRRGRTGVFDGVDRAPPAGR